MTDHIANPALPFHGHLPGGMSVGRRIDITGYVRPTADVFRFDLRTSSGNIALHINPRFHANCIVRNTDRNGWQHEERTGQIHFQKGAGYAMSITCEPAQFNVVINGQHAFNYAHRIPYQEITDMFIDGDIEVHRMIFSGGSPQRPQPRNPHAR